MIHDVDGVRLGRARLQGFKGKCEQRKGNAMSTQFNDRRNPNASLIGCVIKSTHLSLLPVLYCNRCSACPAQPASQPSAYPFPHLVPTRRVDLHKGAPISVSVRWPFFSFAFESSRGQMNGRAPGTHRRQERASAGKKTGRPRAKLCRPGTIILLSPLMIPTHTKPAPATQRTNALPSRQRAETQYTHARLHTHPHSPTLQSTTI